MKTTQYLGTGAAFPEADCPPLMPRASWSTALTTSKKVFRHPSVQILNFKLRGELLSLQTALHASDGALFLPTGVSGTPAAVEILTKSSCTASSWKSANINLRCSVDLAARGLAIAKSCLLFAPF